MATWTAATAIPSGQLITSAWMSNVTGAINFLGANSATAGKDLFFARQTVAQTIPNATNTALTFTTEDIDVAGGHSIVSNTSRYEVKAAGKYRLNGSLAAPAFAATGQNFSVFYGKNGGVLITGGRSYGTFLTHSTTEKCTYVMPTYYVSLGIGDFVELLVYKDVGFTTDVTTAQSTFSVEWVGA